MQQTMLRSHFGGPGPCQIFPAGGEVACRRCSSTRASSIRPERGRAASLAGGVATQRNASQRNATHRNALYLKDHTVRTLTEEPP